MYIFMDPLELIEFREAKYIYEDVCRICLRKNVIMNWNAELQKDFGVTYKECYYKFTQLDLLVKDPYSQMLCQNCARGLKKSHILVKNALESHAILQQSDFQKNCYDNDDIKEESYAREENINYIETLEITIQEEGIPEASNKMTWKDKDIIKETEETSENTFSTSFTDYSDDGEFCAKSPNRIYNNRKIIETPQITANKKASQKNNETNQHLVEISISNEKKKKKIFMCSTCSKFFENKTRLTNHEKAHNKNRERSVTCPECGLRTFTKEHLKHHLETHKEGREKKYKCEFCAKAYFNMGALNVHRRIHLGQMVPCLLCSKQFFRQIDLQKHMNSHSATPINADVKTKSKYHVYCKECDKTMLSSSWKTHEAVHKNQPLMKCSICTKDFFCRKTCVKHMRKIHNKTTKEEYDKFIIACSKSRLSRLILEQQEIIKPKP